MGYKQASVLMCCYEQKNGFRKIWGVNAVTNFTFISLSTKQWNVLLWMRYIAVSIDFNL